MDTKTSTISIPPGGFSSYIKIGKTRDLTSLQLEGIYDDNIHLTVNEFERNLGEIEVIYKLPIKNLSEIHKALHEFEDRTANSKHNIEEEFKYNGEVICPYCAKGTLLNPITEEDVKTGKYPKFMNDYILTSIPLKAMKEYRCGSCNKMWSFAANHDSSNINNSAANPQIKDK